MASKPSSARHDAGPPPENERELAKELLFIRLKKNIRKMKYLNKLQR